MNSLHLEKDYFKNPDKLPLDKLFLDYKTVTRKFSIKDVSIDDVLAELKIDSALEKWKDRYVTKVQKKPAIDECWLLKGEGYNAFQPFYPQFTLKDNRLFIELNNEFLQCLLRLLGYSYHEFWCRMVCETGANVVIVAFLEDALSPYAISFMNEEFRELYGKIHSCIFDVYQRLLEFKVSDIEYMSEETALKYLNKADLLSARSIMFLCYLYNGTQPKFIKKIISLYFDDKYKEKYMEELTDLISYILMQFNRLELGYKSSFELFRTNKTVINTDRLDWERCNPDWLETTSFYVLEMMSSLHEFFSVCKPAVEVALTLELPHRLGHIYQKIYTHFYKMLENASDTHINWSKLQILINEWIPSGREQFVEVFHGFTCHLVDKILGLSENPAEQHKCLESYMDLLSTVLEDHAFIRNYHKVHPLHGHFKVLEDNVPNFDKNQQEYFIESLNQIPEEDEVDYAFVKKKQKESENGPVPFPAHHHKYMHQILLDYIDEVKDLDPKEREEALNYENLPDYVAYALRAIKTWIQMYNENPNRWRFDIEVDQKEVDEFERLIAEGLQSSSGSSYESESEEEFEIAKPSEEEIERNIQIVLGMFPDLGAGFILKCLEKMDYRPDLVTTRILDNSLSPDLAQLPRDLARGAPVNLEKPGSSRAIQEVSNQQPFLAHTGKKSDYRDAKEILDDKKEKAQIKPFVLKVAHNYEADEDYYDDVYDMSYRTYGSAEPITEEGIYSHLQPKSNKNLADIDLGSSSSDSDVEEKPKNAFCEDPAVVRARRYEQMMKKAATQRRGKPVQLHKRKVEKNEKNNGTTQSTKNQTTTQNVQQDRNKKNIHKSSRANHNRKGGAQWKRNKGMVPS